MRGLKVGGLIGLSVLACVLSSGCASIVEGTDQSLTVQTNPTGATCELKREGNVVGIVNPTPGTVNVDKSKNDIAVLCRKDGYQDGSGAFSSDFQGMTFGNILFGGLIGVAVDASSGAMHEYPTSVTVVMQPNTFPNAAERDKFFDGRMAGIRQDADAAVAKLKKDCKPADQKACNEAIAKIEKERDAQLAEVEVKRAQSVLQ